MADTLLRSLGGSEAMLRMPVAATNAIGEQLGAPTAGFADLPLAPAAFRKVRVPIKDGGDAEYELLLSASAVEVQVSQLGLYLCRSAIRNGVGDDGGRRVLLDRRRVLYQRGRTGMSISCAATNCRPAELLTTEI